MLVNDDFTAYTSLIPFFTKIISYVNARNFTPKALHLFKKNEDEGADFTQCPLCDLSEEFDNAID